MTSVLSAMLTTWLIMAYGKLYGEHWGPFSIPEILEARFKYLITGKRQPLC